jgi:G patch domain-containing protein 1
MTSRLKHKLDLEQINLKSSYLNESFVQVGLGSLIGLKTNEDGLILSR